MTHVSKHGVNVGQFRKSSYTRNEFFDGKHRFEHWYRDNTVYFITSKVRDGFAAFATEEAKQTSGIASTTTRSFTVSARGSRR